MVRHAESIAIQGAESEVGVLLLSSPVTELAGGDGVLLWVDDPQPPGGPVLCLLVVIQGLCPHLSAETNVWSSLAVVTNCKPHKSRGSRCCFHFGGRIEPPAEDVDDNNAILRIPITELQTTAGSERGHLV